MRQKVTSKERIRHDNLFNKYRNILRTIGGGNSCPFDLNILKTGSVEVCKNIYSGFDYDLVILIQDKRMYDTFTDLIKSNGYSNCCPEDDEFGYNDDTFVAYRKDDVNLIVTDDKKLFKNFESYTKLAKQLPMEEKKDRITLARYILYGDS